MHDFSKFSRFNVFSIFQTINFLCVNMLLMCFKTYEGILITSNVVLMSDLFFTMVDGKSHEDN